MNNYEDNLIQQLNAILPSTFITMILSCVKEKNGFTGNVRVNIKTKAEALEWLKQFTAKSFCTFKVDRTHPENSQKLVFKKEYRCVHNTRPSSHKVKNPHPKHTDCRARLSITVKQNKLRRSKDQYLKDFPTEIMIRHTHNHMLYSADLLRNSTPTEEVEEIFIENFSKDTSETKLLTAPDIDPLEDETTISYKYLKERPDTTVVLKQLDNIFTDLKTKLTENPETFLKPIEAFVKSFFRIKTDSSLISALNTFGQYSGTAEAESLKINFNGGNTIKKEPASVARRRTITGGRGEYSYAHLKRKRTLSTIKKET